MKKGDIVRIFDGSYSMMQENGKLGRCSGNVLIADGEYEVVDVANCFSKFPSEKPFMGDRIEKNNLKLRCVKNPSRIVYIQSRFCSKIR